MSRDYDGSRRRMEPMGYGGARVYVGDIGDRIGRVELQREFEHYGQVLDVWMTPYNESRFQDKKFAFVVFRHPEDAEAAVRDKSERLVCGRKVRVEHAKPPRSQMSRDYHRGGGYMGRGGFSRGRGGGGGGGYYNNMGSRQPLSPRMNRPRQRSFSPRDRDRSYRRSPPSNGAPRNRRPSYEDQHQYQDRSRVNNYNEFSPERSPDRRMKRLSSFSPEARPKKQSRSLRQDSPSVSPSPPRQARPPSDNSVASRSLSPPNKRFKKKKKKHSRRRSRSMSASPVSSPGPQPSPPPAPRQAQHHGYYNKFDDGKYEKAAKSHGGSHHKMKKSKSSKKKKREMESGEDYSSDDSSH